MDKMRIGWIGLGNMGVPMVKNLVKAGFPVTVYNRTAAKAGPLMELGARLAESPAGLLENCDIVITMVADDAALRQINTGEKGLLSGGSFPGKSAVRRSSGIPVPGGGSSSAWLLIDMSTVSPATSRWLSEQHAAKGREYLDAPVSGSVKPAEDGQLVIMVGGKRTAYEEALPIFGCLGKQSFYLGDQGAGNIAKLGINLLLAFTIQGLAETALFAQENGIALKDMFAIVNESALASGITRLKANNILDNNYRAAFALKHLAKDLRLAEQQGMHSPAGGTVHDSFQQALAAGFGEEDMSAILPFLSGGKSPR